MFALIIFALAGAAIAISVVLACIENVKISREIAKVDKKISYQKIQTLIEISHLLKDLSNAKNDNERKQLTKQLEEIRTYIRKYY